MKRHIYKYKLGVKGVVEVKMPPSGKVVAVGFQGDHLFAWAIVDAEEEAETRDFLVCFTGDWFDDTAWRHVGTAHLGYTGGHFVAHVFERAEQS